MGTTRYRNPSPHDMRVAEEAAVWLLRLEDKPSEACRAEFVAWLRQSARHLEEFLFAKAASRELDRADSFRKVDISKLTDDEVVLRLKEDEASSSRAGAVQSVSKARTAWRHKGVLAAGTAALLLAPLVFNHYVSGSQIYTTPVGDQRSVKLPDGSVMQLNTRSRAQVRFSATARDIRLLEGEALFVVEKDAARPFRVITDTATVRAIGTRFNVYSLNAATRVAVVEGVVQISPEQPRTAPSRLVAGEEAEVAVDRVVKAAAPDVERAIAWRQRRLVFRADRLEHVAAEFNRYNLLQICVEGAGVRERRVSGVFDADDPQPLVQFLEADLQLQVEKSKGVIVVRRR